MNKIILISLLLLNFNLSFSQNDKKTIGITPPNQYQEEVYYAGIEEAIVSSRKFVVAERSKMDQIKKERNLQRSEDYIDKSKLKEGIFQGIDYLVIFNNYNNNIQLKIVDVNTTEIIDIRTFTTEDYSNNIPKWLNTIIPTIYKVFELNGKTIVFNGGTFDDIKKNEKLDVVEEKKYDNVLRYSKIGEIIVVATEGKDVSTSKIQKGKNDINKVPIQNLRIQRVSVGFENSKPNNSTVKDKKTSFEEKEYKPKKRRTWGWWLAGGLLLFLFI